MVWELLVEDWLLLGHCGVLNHIKEKLASFYFCFQISLTSSQHLMTSDCKRHKDITYLSYTKGEVNEGVNK